MFEFNHKTRHHQIQGMTLVEVMIALVILSVGLLGLAGLQIHGLRGTSSSNSRVQAVFIISDMAERMHANTIAVNDNLAYAAILISASACGAAPPSCNNVAAPCSPAALALHDNFEICNSMTASLPPGATLSITCDGGTSPCNPSTDPDLRSTHTLLLSWSEVRDASLGAVPPQTVTLNIRP